jgi:hypothetical protein
MIFLLSMSAMSLNAMMPDVTVPDVTRWQEICKDPVEEQKLMTVYKSFCQKRVNNNISWLLGSWASCVLCATKTFRNMEVVARTKVVGPMSIGICGLFAIRQSYLLGRNAYLNNLALKEDLSYLNHDVLEQLGYSSVRVGRCSFRVLPYVDSSISTQEFFAGFTPDETLISDNPSSVDNVNGIKKALSGCYFGFYDNHYDEIFR